MNIAITELEAKKEKLLSAGKYRKNRRQENEQYYREEIADLENAIRILKQANGQNTGERQLTIPRVSGSLPISDKEYKQVITAIYPTDNSKKFRRQ